MLASTWLAALLAQTAPAVPAPVDLDSPALRVHASLPQNEGYSGQRLDDVLAGTGSRAAALRLPKNLEKVIIDEPEVSADGLDVLAIYKRLACSSDAIVTGYVTRLSSHLSASACSIYTDCDFAIESVLKDNRLAPIDPKTDIAITRVGGSVHLPNGTVSLANETFPAFRPDTTYLLFLSYIAASAGYTAAGRFATLARDGSQWKSDREKVRFSDAVFTVNVFEEAAKVWPLSCSK